MISRTSKFGIWAATAVIAAGALLSVPPAVIAQVPIIASFVNAFNGHFGNLVAGANGLNLTPWNNEGYTQGSWLSFNNNGGASGETDFINYHPTLTGGFDWWVPTTSSLGSSIMHLSPSGTLTVAQVAGNAATATTAGAFTSAPTPCAGGALAGITVSGNPTSCVTLAAAQHATVAVSAQTFPNTATTHITLSFTLSTTPAAGAVVVCTPQSDFGDETQYTCWATGTTLFLKLTHGTVGLPFTTNAINLNYAVMQ